MSLRINTNVSALNTHRQVTTNSAAQAKSLERLSSGLKINRGADGPAQLQISEQFRAQSSGLQQAIKNSEMGVSLVQTAEAALDEVSRALINARQIAVHASNDAVNDPQMLDADQQELNSILNTINRISANTQYGKNTLLDGSRAGQGVVVGEGLEFVSAGTEAKTSDAQGYDIQISKAATRGRTANIAMVTGTSSTVNGRQVHDEGSGLQMTIEENGKVVHFEAQSVTEDGQFKSAEQNWNELKAAIKDAGLNLTLEKDATGGHFIQHKEYGSDAEFTVTQKVAGGPSQMVAGFPPVPPPTPNPDGSMPSTPGIRGTDIEGKINGEEAFGKGQILTGAKGAENTEGIKIRYVADESKTFTPGVVGKVTFSQNSLTFQTGANDGQTTKLSMKSIRSDQLANGVEQEYSDAQVYKDKATGFKSLQDVDVRFFEGAQDSIRVIDKAIEEIASVRAELGAFQKNDLESNLNYLRIANENTQSSESVIRDADMAQEMVTLTRNQILSQSSMAMLAQANQKQQSVLQLII